jgi:hypothetical protein
VPPAASGEEVGEEEEESDDELCDRTTAPVPKSKWEVLAGNRAVWVQLCQQLRLVRGVWVRGGETGAS